MCVFLLIVANIVKLGFREKIEKDKQDKFEIIL
jgi:hypothetical protein